MSTEPRLADMPLEELRELRQRLATTFPAGHLKAQRTNERIAAVDEEIRIKAPQAVEEWEDAAAVSVLHVCAPNSPSGNPRRCYAVLCRSRVLAVVDEGYEGTGALRTAGWAHAVPNIVGDVDVSVREYKRWLTRGNADRAVA